MLAGTGRWKRTELLRGEAPAGERAPSVLAVGLNNPPEHSVGVAMRVLVGGLERLGYDVRTYSEDDPRGGARPGADEVVLTWGIGQGTRHRRAWFRACLDPCDGWKISEADSRCRNAGTDVTFGLGWHSCRTNVAAGVRESAWLPLGVRGDVFHPGGAAEFPEWLVEGGEWFGGPCDLADPNRFVFLHQSAMQPRKGVGDLVRAYLAEFTADDHVVLVLKAWHDGWGRDSRKEVERWWREAALCARPSLGHWVEGREGEAGLAPILYTWGAASAEEQAACYRAADAYVTVSRLEGWGLPALEALACGTRVVATEGTHDDFLTSENAILIPTKLECMADAGEEVLYGGKITEEVARRVRWYRPEVDGIRAALREVVDEWACPQERAVAMARTARWFSPEYSASVLVDGLRDRGVRLATRPVAITRRATVCLGIPVFNDLRLLEWTLATLRITRGVDFQVLIQDDGSTDGTADWVSRGRWPFPVEVVRTESQGLSRSRQALAERYMALRDRPEFFCYLGAGLEFTDPDWLAKFCELHLEGVSGPKLLLPNGGVWSAGGAPIVPPTFWLTLRGYNGPDGPEWDMPQVVEHVPGACMFLRGSLFDQGVCNDLGYENVFAGDTDFCLAATRPFGTHCHYWPQVVITHHGSKARPRDSERERVNWPSFRRFYEKWYPGDVCDPVRSLGDGELCQGSESVRGENCWDFSQAVIAHNLVGGRRHAVTTQDTFAFGLVGAETNSTVLVLRALEHELRGMGYGTKTLGERGQLTPKDVLVRWTMPHAAPPECTAVVDPVDGWHFDSLRIDRLNQCAVTFGLGRDSTDALTDMGVLNAEPLALGIDPVQWPVRERRGSLPGFGLVTTFGQWHRDPFRFLVVASVQPRKNLFALIAAYRAEFNADEPVVLYVKASVHGWGIDPTGAMRAAYAGTGGPGCNVIVDPLGRASMLALYHACDCLVSASVEEGWGCTGLEGVAAGLQVAVTDGPGHRDWANAEACHLIPTRAVRMADLQDVAAATQQHGLTAEAARHIRCGVPDEAGIRVALRTAYEQGRELTRGQVQGQAAIRERFTMRRTADEFLAGLAKHGVEIPLRG